MTNDKFEKPLDDHSNAAMTHTSEGIATSDFVIRDLDINKEPEMKRESKISGKMHGHLKRNKLVIGMIGLILIIILALVGPLISKHDFL